MDARRVMPVECVEMPELKLGGYLIGYSDLEFHRSSITLGSGARESRRSFRYIRGSPFTVIVVSSVIPTVSNRRGVS